MYNSWKNYHSMAFVTVLLFCLTSLAPAQNALSHNTFFTIDYPLAGVTNTEAVASTPSGIIVGNYYDSAGVQHGFMLKDRVFTSIDFPGANSSGVTWINDSGVIVGTYNSGSEMKVNTYILTGGTFTTINYPGDNTNTYGFGIDDADDIVGPECACNFTQATGFLYTYSTGTFTLFSYPNAVGTYPTMTVDPTKYIVGSYLDQASVYHGFLLTGGVNGVFSNIDYPDSTFTWITGINAASEMVGFYRDQSGNQHGFEYNLPLNAFYSIDISGATSTEVNGINSVKGNLVGRYTTPDGHTHGYFLQSPH